MSESGEIKSEFLSKKFPYLFLVPIFYILYLRSKDFIYNLWTDRDLYRATFGQSSENLYYGAELDAFGQTPGAYYKILEVLTFGTGDPYLLHLISLVLFTAGITVLFRLLKTKYGWGTALLCTALIFQSHVITKHQLYQWNPSVAQSFFILGLAFFLHHFWTDTKKSIFISLFFWGLGAQCHLSMHIICTFSILYLLGSKKVKLAMVGVFAYALAFSPYLFHVFQNPIEISKSSLDVLNSFSFTKKDLIVTLRLIGLWPIQSTDPENDWSFSLNFKTNLTLLVQCLPVLAAFMGSVLVKSSKDSSREFKLLWFLILFVIVHILVVKLSGLGIRDRRMFGVAIVTPIFVGVLSQVYIKTWFTKAWIYAVLPLLVFANTFFVNSYYMKMFFDFPSDRRYSKYSDFKKLIDDIKAEVASKNINSVPHLSFAREDHLNNFYIGTPYSGKQSNIEHLIKTEGLKWSKGFQNQCLVVVTNEEYKKYRLNDGESILGLKAIKKFKISTQQNYTFIYTNAFTGNCIRTSYNSYLQSPKEFNFRRVRFFNFADVQNYGKVIDISGETYIEIQSEILWGYEGRNHNVFDKVYIQTKKSNGTVVETSPTPWPDEISHYPQERKMYITTAPLFSGPIFFGPLKNYEDTLKVEIVFDNLHLTQKQGKGKDITFQVEMK